MRALGGLFLGGTISSLVYAAICLADHSPVPYHVWTVAVIFVLMAIAAGLLSILDSVASIANSLKPKQEETSEGD